MNYETLQDLVEAVEDNNKQNDGSWRNWPGAYEIFAVYQAEYDVDIAQILNEAIATDGKSLPVALREAELSEWVRTLEVEAIGSH